jgi:hypothetical protein
MLVLSPSRRCRWPGGYLPGQRPRTSGLVILLAVALVATVGACGQPTPRLTAAPAATPAAVLIDVDPYGAILRDDRGHYVGVTRDGATVWREPAGVKGFALVSCLARCPDAVLSTRPDTADAFAVADPVPRLVMGGQWTPLNTLAGPTRRVLTATSAKELVVAGGDPTSGAWLELRRPGTPVQRLGVGGFTSTWQRSADARRALAITVVANGNEARWLTRTDQGWQPTGGTVSITGLAACLTPDGSRALLLGQRPAVLDHNGNQRPWTDLDSASVCAWAASGGIVAELAATMGGRRSRLRAFDNDGAVRWRLDVAEEASVTADPTSTRVAYLVGRTLHEIDTVRGIELRTIPGIQSGRYDANGDLVTIAEDGAIAWRR